MRMSKREQSATTIPAILAPNYIVEYVIDLLFIVWLVVLEVVQSKIPEHLEEPNPGLTVTFESEHPG